MHILNFADVEKVGGIERNLVQFIRETVANGSITHSLFADSGNIHPFLRPDVLNNVKYLASVKHVGKVKIPRWPAVLRVVHQDRFMRRCGADLALLWHWFGDRRRVDICGRAGLPAVYWERGLAWGNGGRHTDSFLGSLAGVLSNCYAGKRMLELRWGYTGDTVVIPNAVIPRRTAQECGRSRPACAGPFRIGAAGRLRSFKGINLALHAVARLIADGRNVRLDIAGDGPMRDDLRRLAERLGIAEHVFFLGLVDDMPAFFAALDCYLHPALREPFGSVCAEAQSYGCPVLTTRVDGMPEVVMDGETGYCLPAMLDMTCFAAFGGDPTDVHALVYEPAEDRLRKPAFVDPEAFAEKIAGWMDAPDVHLRFCRAALVHARERFALEPYLERVDKALSAIKGAAVL